MNFREFIGGGSLLLALLCAAGCDETKKSTSSEEEVPVLTFSSESIHIPVNAGATVYIDVTPAGRAEEVILNVSDEKVAVFDGTPTVSEGRITANLKPVALGETTLIALIDDVVEECPIIIDPVAVESISLNLSSCELAVGEVVTLVATIKPDDATNPTVAWSTDKQNEEDKVVEIDNGVVTAVKAGTTVVTAACGDFSTSCTVTVHNVYANSISLDITEKEITAGETFYIDATVLPDNVTFKSVTWISSDEEVLTLEPFDAKVDDNILSVKALSHKAGSAVITAKIDGQSAQCNVTVNAVVVILPDPKIGDYFYSDGTWSDGGLISINPDGTNPVWADVKPAPEVGKTVIGIIFQTNSDRICDELKNAGYTKGLVFGLCGLYDKAQMNDPGYKRLCSFTSDYSFSCLSGTRLTGYRWYNDKNGKVWTDKVVKAYPGEQLLKCPVFDFATTDYRLPAPTSTSGWYVPSIGELWDFVANFGGDELARYMLQFRDYGEVFDTGEYEGEQEDFDITQYSSIKKTDENGNYVKDEAGHYVYLYGVKKLSYNPVDKINSIWSLVPEDQRDDLFYCYGDSKVQLFSSTVYMTSRESGPESCAMFMLGKDNSFDFEAGWLHQDPMICHPVLAF